MRSLFKHWPSLRQAKRIRRGKSSMRSLLQSPNDPYTLFLSARICRSLNDSAGEADSLEKLVAIGEKSAISTANYRIYLGQAYARQSLAEPALQNYRAALKSGQLDAKQAEEVQDAIKSIESKTTP